MELHTGRSINCSGTEPRTDRGNTTLAAPQRGESASQSLNRTTRPVFRIKPPVTVSRQRKSSPFVLPRQHFMSRYANLTNLGLPRQVCLTLRTSVRKKMAEFQQFRIMIFDGQPHLGTTICPGITKTTEIRYRDKKSCLRSKFQRCR